MADYLRVETLEHLWFDNDARDAQLRKVVEERMAAAPPPQSADHIVASYFFAFRHMQLSEAVGEISYHATSGVKHPPQGSLLEQCSAIPMGVDAFDATGRMGLLHVGIPLKMMLQPDGHLTSCDILHTTAAAIIFDVYENLDSRLVALQVPFSVMQTFPGPAYGPEGVRRITRFPSGKPAFGTILKPTAGITPEEVGNLVEEAARCPLFLFVKEDEDLYPNLQYSPVAMRTKHATDAIAKALDERGGVGLLFAPHISGAPHEVLETVHAVVDAGATAVMFSETFAGGTVRMVREATREMAQPPAIYGHNAGIGVKTRAIFREVIDMLARLDGIDFRQTAPIKPGQPFLKPYGDEWSASERMLSCPLGDAKPVMIARAGALDQGNIGLNLADAEQHGMEEAILFLAGSAINSIKDTYGRSDPQIGTQAMLQALEIHYSGALRGVSMETHLAELYSIAVNQGHHELQTALKQRYPGVF